MAERLHKGAVVVDGLMEFLRAASKAEPEFDKAMRFAGERVAQSVTDLAKQNAAAIAPHGSGGRSQAAVVVSKLLARRERIPVIKLDHKRGFVSVSRPNAKRRRNVTAGDVFFGAEFGGRARKRTQQFQAHRGRRGYFFWQAVRDRRSFIAKEYMDAQDDVLRSLAPGAK